MIRHPPSAFNSYAFSCKNYRIPLRRSGGIPNMRKRIGILSFLLWWLCLFDTKRRVRRAVPFRLPTWCVARVPHSLLMHFHIKFMLFQKAEAWESQIGGPCCCYFIFFLLAPSHTPRSKRNRRLETYDTLRTAPTQLCSQFPSYELSYKIYPIP